MFQWDKSISCIDVEAGKVLHLFKSMREVQLALPGVSAQQATAYLCQYVHGEGVATVAAFHLHKSNILAFYCSDPLVVPVSKTDSMLDQGLNFVESMGFLLTDQDIHLLDGEDQEMLWESLPLKTGIADDEEESHSAPDESAVVEQPTKSEATKAKPKESKSAAEPLVEAIAAEEKTVVVESKGNVKAPDASEDVAENVDDLLAAVEAMRAKRPGLRARKAMPSAEEMDRRKQELRENIGRILASQ